MSFRNPVRSPLLQRGVTGGGVEGAYARSRSSDGYPHTVPDILVTMANVNLDGLYAARIKRRPDVVHTLHANNGKTLYLGAGTNNSGGAVECAVGIYEIYVDNNHPVARKVKIHRYSTANGVSFGVGAAAILSDAVRLEPLTDYMFTFWVGSGSCASNNVVSLSTPGSLSGAGGLSYASCPDPDIGLFKFSALNTRADATRLQAGKERVILALFPVQESEYFLY